MRNTDPIDLIDQEWSKIDLRLPAKLASSADEHTFQKNLMASIAARAVIEPALLLAHAIPNGGMRHKATAGKLKAEGVKSGVPDICIPVPSHPFHGLYLELKTKANTASDAQKWWLMNLSRMGYKCAVVNDKQTALRVIAEYFRNEKLK
jgi:hypothetical protein